MITTGELARHSHELKRPQWYNPKIDTTPVGGTESTIYGYTDGTTRHYSDKGNIQATGNNIAHNNISPYCVVVAYKRIS